MEDAVIQETLSGPAAERGFTPKRQRLRGEHKEAQVIGVKAMISEGCDPKVVAELFNLKESTVERIYRQK